MTDTDTDAHIPDDDPVEPVHAPEHDEPVPMVPVDDETPGVHIPEDPTGEFDPFV